MLHYDSRSYASDETAIPALGGRELLTNIAAIVAGGLGLCFWRCVLAPAYSLAASAGVVVFNALNPAQASKHLTSFSELALRSPGLSAVVIPSGAYLAVRLLRVLVRLFRAATPK